MQIEHMGMTIECVVRGGERETPTSPGEPYYAEVYSIRVSDWDEFAEMWGARGERPMFAPGLPELLSIIVYKEWDKIEESALDCYKSEEPSFDDDMLLDFFDTY